MPFPLPEKFWVLTPRHFQLESRHQKSLHLHWTVTSCRFLEYMGASADFSMRLLGAFQKVAAGLLVGDRCLQQKASSFALLLGKGP